VAFREAHEVVGRLVRSCIDQNKTFEDLTDEEWAALHPVFAAQKPPLTALESINARDIPGGTATPRVTSAIEEARESLTGMQQWIDREMAVRTRTFSRNSPGASPR